MESSNKNPIGYLLNSDTLVDAVDALIHASSNFGWTMKKQGKENVSKYGYNFAPAESSESICQIMKRAKVLDVWFTPVYEPHYKEGDFVIATGNIHGYERKLAKVMQHQPNLAEHSEWMLDFSVSGLTTAIYGQIHRRATQSEIDEAPITIGGYTCRFVNDKIAFGCQEFTIQELQFIRRLMVFSELQAKITIVDTPITEEIINKVIRFYYSSVNTTV